MITVSPGASVGTRISVKWAWKRCRRRRPLYEDKDARIFILANGQSEGRIRLCRLLRPADPEPLADGAGHTFGRDGDTVQARSTSGALIGRSRCRRQPH